MPKGPLHMLKACSVQDWIRHDKTISHVMVFVMQVGQDESSFSPISVKFWSLHFFMGQSCPIQSSAVPSAHQMYPKSAFSAV